MVMDALVSLTGMEGGGDDGYGRKEEEEPLVLVLSDSASDEGVELRMGGKVGGGNDDARRDRRRKRVARMRGKEGGRKGKEEEESEEEEEEEGRGGGDVFYASESSRNMDVEKKEEDGRGGGGDFDDVFGDPYGESDDDDFEEDVDYGKTRKGREGREGREGGEGVGVGEEEEEEETMVFSLVSIGSGESGDDDDDDGVVGVDAHVGVGVYDDDEYDDGKPLPEKEVRELLVLFMELAVHAFLYKHRVYPRSTFTPTRMFNVHTYISRSEALVSYIRTLVSGSAAWIEEKSLQSVKIIVFDDLPNLLWDAVEECDAVDRAQGGQGIISAILVLQMSHYASPSRPPHGCRDGLHSVLGSALLRIRESLPSVPKPKSKSTPDSSFQIKITTSAVSTCDTLSSAPTTPSPSVVGPEPQPLYLMTSTSPSSSASCLETDLDMTSVLSSALPGTSHLLNVYALSPQ